jgi:hypothetical protein
LGKSVYIDFLASWNAQYLDKTASEEKLKARLSLPLSKINSIVMQPHETRQLMNYWLL